MYTRTLLFVVHSSYVIQKKGNSLIAGTRDEYNIICTVLFISMISELVMLQTTLFGKGTIIYSCNKIVHNDV